MLCHVHYERGLKGNCNNENDALNKLFFPYTGNTLDNSDSILTKVEVLNINQQGGSEQSKQVWTGNDKLLKVSAIQQDLNKLDLPNTFWFR